MNKSIDRLKKFLEHTIPWLVLAILLFYNYIDFLRRPFGFEWLPDSTISKVFVEQPAPTLIVGDRLMQVGSLGWDEYQADLGKTFFEGVRIGETVPVVVERNGQEVVIWWRLPGFNRGELLSQLAGQWFLAYFFWVAGLLTVLFLRPKDERWGLLSAFNFLTAIWLIAGSGPSNYHLWYSAFVLRAAIWICVPVYLHLHWVFPRPLGKLPPRIIWPLYTAGIGLTIGQLFQVFPPNLYFLGFLAAILGSLVLLIAHYYRQLEARREVRFISIMAFYAFLPLIVLAMASIISRSTPATTLAFVSFTTIPFAYLYLAYYRQLGGLEVRVNRLISTYFFIILIGISGLSIFIAAELWLPQHDGLIVNSLSILLAAILSIWGFPRFQNFVEQHFLGIPISSGQLQEVYSTRATASTSINALVDLLKEVMLPDLLVRQFMFVKFSTGTVRVLLAVGLDEKRIIGDDNLSKLIKLKNLAPESIQTVKPYPWVRLTLPLTVGKEILGLWLLGRRDPDDFYSEHEFPMLQSLANQTGIALSNILQTERLHKMYKDDIERNEKSRHRLALDLHDSVLNQLAILRLSVDDTHISPNFQGAYDEVTSRLREIVTELRPPMLTYGLKFAIVELADNMMERSKTAVDVVTAVQAEGEARYAENIEQHLFRIIQESCENALHHSQATQIKISAKLMPERIWLSIEDNGIGFETGGPIELDDLLANKHFGLAGMMERATFIGAQVEINSFPKAGTHISIALDAIQHKAGMTRQRSNDL
ncbi:MAG: ATP-binding protein [Anaerolineales bacterium]|nr:ATP-binding protein [Anaerolineales bacterium]